MPLGEPGWEQLFPPARRKRELPRGKEGGEGAQRGNCFAQGSALI